MISGWDLVWLKTLNFALTGRQPNLFRKVWVFYVFIYFFWCACFWVWFFTWFLAFVVGDGCEGTIESWTVRLHGNAFPMLSSCVVLFSISLFPIVFYIERNVRFRCGGKANWKFWGNLNLRKFKLENLWVNLILGRAWVLWLCMFYSYYVDLIHVIHAY